MQFSWSQLPRPIVGLAPMADMTDSAFCRLVKKLASPIIFREMVSSEAVVRDNQKTLDMAAIHDSERPIIQQIFGADPQTMAEAARKIVETHQPEGIDINMGCPVYKITSNFNGAALMKDPQLAEKIVRAVKEAINIPLSVKTRAGWSDHQECIEFSKRLEAAGADLISIHGRTKTQAYSGTAHRDVVAAAKQAVSIPILYNGDIFTWQDFFTALNETDCDGALIARGALGNPWIFSQIQAKLDGDEPAEVTLEQRVELAKKHLNLHLAQHGADKVPTFRKHLSWYFKGVPNFKEYKPELMTAPDQKSVERILNQALVTLTRES